MKNKITKFLRLSLSVILPSLIVAGVAYAGSLTAPSGTPAATSYTLDDIYTRLTTNAAATAGNHSLSTTTSPAASFHTLTQIYGAIPTITASDFLASATYLGVTGSITVMSGNTASASSSAQSTSLVITVPQGYYSGAASVTVSSSSPNFVAGNIANGVSLFGITGSLLGNEWNGTGQEINGGSQANGGVDDYNNASASPTDTYTTSWTACNSGNNYCGTGDSGANAKDNATGLTWSYPCLNSGCSSMAASSSPTTYSWDNSGTKNGSMTAYQLCSQHSGWSLPHQKQLMQAYIDGAYSNLDSGTILNYVSATAVAQSLTSEWLVGLSTGKTQSVAKSSTFDVRCIR